MRRFRIKMIFVAILIKILIKLSPSPLDKPMKLPKMLEHEKLIVLPEDIWNSLIEKGLINEKERENLKEIKYRNE